MRLMPCLLLLLFPAALLKAAPSVESRRLFNEGNALYLAKDYDKALSSYAASLRLDNTSASVYQGVGNCYAAKGDAAAALKYYRYALQLKPGDAALSATVAKLQGQDLASQGQELYKARRYDEALRAFSAAAEREPGNARVQQGIGNAHYAKGDKPAALAAYRKSLELDPSNTALENFLASWAPGSAPSGAAAGSGGGDWGGALWRSALLPGWGQAHNGQSGKGWVLGGLTLAFLGAEIGTYVVGDAARTQYASLKGAGADYDGTYRTWESMAGLNHLFFIASSSLYVWNLVDAAVGAGKAKPAYGSLQAPALQVGFNRAGMGAQLALAGF